MAANAELGILLTAKDTASGVLRAFSGAAVAGLIGAMSDAARAGADLGASDIRLKTAVDNTTTSFDSQSATIAAAIEKAKSYGSSSIEINDSLALLTEQTGSASEAIKRLMVAEDLAHGAHIDLYTASKLLGKATDENTNTLSRFGIVIQKGADLTTMLGAVEAKFGKEAENYGNSTAGAIAKTTVALDDWKAGIGNAFGPAQVFIALLPGMSAGFSGIAAALALLTPAQIAWAASTWAAIAPWLLVIAVAVLVVEALMQIWETVTLVTDNWDKFTTALTRGDLNNIPIFGFFFEKAQQVLALIDSLRGAWQALQNLMSGVGGAFSGLGSAVHNATGLGFAEGGIVPGPIGAPMMAVVHGGEEVRTPAQQSGGGGLTLVFNAPVYGMADFEDKVKAIVRDTRLGGGFRGT